MLKRLSKTRSSTSCARIAIVASKYNPRFVNGMLRAAQATLTKAGAEVRVVRVPGAFEIPVVAAELARASERPAAVICLGVILRGATHHAQTICDAITQSLARIQVDIGVPVIHEIGRASCRERV